MTSRDADEFVPLVKERADAIAETMAVRSTQTNEPARCARTCRRWPRKRRRRRRSSAAITTGGQFSGLLAAPRAADLRVPGDFSVLSVIASRTPRCSHQP
jgi:hypothetical protein